MEHERLPYNNHFTVRFLSFLPSFFHTLLIPFTQVKVFDSFFFVKSSNASLTEKNWPVPFRSLCLPHFASLTFKSLLLTWISLKLLRVSASFKNRKQFCRQQQDRQSKDIHHLSHWREKWLFMTFIFILININTK